jgi:hypothetical protein
MHVATESSSARIPGNPKMRFGGADPAADCDLCGRPVRRETAFERIHHGDDGIVVVLVCPECECGAD